MAAVAVVTRGLMTMAWIIIVTRSADELKNFLRGEVTCFLIRYVRKCHDRSWRLPNFQLSVCKESYDIE
jgi:hypothetical protein